MKYWNEMLATQTAKLKAAVAERCMQAAGITDATKQTALADVFAQALKPYEDGDCRCVYDPGPYDDDNEFFGFVAGVVMAGRPFLSTISAIIRSTTSGASTVTEYGRRVTSESESKSGTENVAIDATDGTDKLALQVPDLRTNTASSVNSSDVDAGEKFRFYDDARRVLLLQFDAWIRRVTVSWDL